MALSITDPDRLLDGYRVARSHDEFVDASGEVRPAWQEFAELLAERGRAGMKRLHEVLRGLVDDDGITYIEIDHHGEAVTDSHGMAVPGPWHLDGIPLLVSAADWQTLEAGVVQRSRLLDAVLRDLYGEQRSLTSGILPAPLLYGHPGYLRAVRGIHDPAANHLFMLGCDVSRGADGDFLVNRDWTQAPSGAGYALADRRVVSQAVPDFYERIRPRPASPFAQALRLALIDAAPAKRRACRRLI